MRAPLLLAACAPLLAGCVFLYVNEPTRPLPEWRSVSTVPRPLGCARVSPRVVQSGKEGVGLVLVLEGAGDPCTLQISSATLRVGAVEARAVDLPPAPRLAEGTRVEAHLAFPFDADAAWSRGDRQGELVLRLSSGEAVVLPLAARDRWDEGEVRR
jgi:hypothetical protein